MKKIFILILALLLVFSIVQIIKTTYDYRNSQQVYESLQSEFVETKDIEDTDPDIFTHPVEEAETAPITIDFNSLLEKNGDIVGWIYCQGTPINYPVVQAENNDYYLRRDLNGKYLFGGTVFVDYRNAAIGEDNNYILYGHNMKDGTMFSSLTKYKKQSYYDKHPVLYYLTPDVNYKIELYAGIVVRRDAIIYAPNPDEEEFAEFLHKAKTNSSFDSDIEISENDTLITLSTCSYEYNNARYIIIGKLVEILAQ